MGKYRWLKSECLHVVGDLESKRLKVAALNLFHPTASPFCEEPCFHIATQPLGGEDKGEGATSLKIRLKNGKLGI